MNTQTNISISASNTLLFQYQAAVNTIGLSSGDFNTSNTVSELDESTINDEKRRLDDMVHSQTGKHIPALIASFDGYQLLAYNTLYQRKLMEQDVIELKIDFAMAKKYTPRT